MFILPTWVLILGTSIVFLLAFVFGMYLMCFMIATEANEKLNDSELKVFKSLMNKIGRLENSR